MTVFVYVWKRPCGTPFYVGVGKGRRPWVRQRGRWATSIRSSIEKAGGVVSVEILQECATYEEAWEVEKALILQHGRLDLGTGSLANMTSGGEGCPEVSPEVRRRMRDMKLGVRNPKLSEYQRGRPATEAQKALLLEYAKRPKSAEHRARIGAAKRGQFHTEETKAKIRATKQKTRTQHDSNRIQDTRPD